jgi:hypothetical protein
MKQKYLAAIWLFLVAAGTFGFEVFAQTQCGAGYSNFYQHKIRQCGPADNCGADLCAYDYCESGPCWGYLTFCIRPDLCTSGAWSGCWNNVCF